MVLGSILKYPRVDSCYLSRKSRRYQLSGTLLKTFTVQQKKKKTNQKIPQPNTKKTQTWTNHKQIKPSTLFMRQNPERFKAPFLVILFVMMLISSSTLVVNILQAFWSVLKYIYFSKGGTGYRLDVHVPIGPDGIASTTAHGTAQCYYTDTWSLKGHCHGWSFLGTGGKQVLFPFSRSMKNRIWEAVGQSASS